jgi:pyroglutamyl-peptidase
MAQPRVLLTGFGPFPGVAENSSGWLAETLAARKLAHDVELHGYVLPTEWNAVAAFAPDLHSALQPHVMIHFGVSPSARSLRIERSAHNQTAPRHDASGRLPVTPAISPAGTARIDTGLPVSEIAAHLRAQGFAASASPSCGRYLCNFLYYRSLEWAQAQGRNALFVHVPLTHVQGGPFAADALLDAAQETVNIVLRFVAAQEASRMSTPHQTPVPEPTMLHAEDGS